MTTAVHREESPSWLRRLARRPMVWDWVATGLAVWLAVTHNLDNPRLGPLPAWLNMALGVAVALTLLARRRLPEVVLAVSLAAHAVQLSTFTVFFALYAEGAFRGPKRRGVVLVAALVSFVAFVAAMPSTWHEPQLLLSQQGLAFLLTVVVPMLFGMYVGERRAVLNAVVDRAERAEREQTLIADAAVAEERRRIAGEMHDVVSHQVSLMVVHANALQYVAEDPATAKEASRTIATAGRQALNELREMIGVLRRPQGEEERHQAAGETALTAAGDGTQEQQTVPGSSSPPAEPAPTEGFAEVATSGAGEPAEEVGTEVGAQGPALARVPALVDSSRSAGLPVELRTTGEPRRLPEATERAAYRIVQEALTNVHKHAPGADTQVQLVYRAESIRVSVRNSAPPKGSSGAATLDGAPLLPSGGHGLIGLRERVRLAGGGIETGPRPGGGFLVVAELPTVGAETVEAGTGAVEA